MSEHWILRGDATLYARVDGVTDAKAPTVVFSNSLGTDLHLWDAILPFLPAGLRIVRMDSRGHGRSSAPPAPYGMGTLVSDAEAVCDTLKVKDCVFVGLSMGGMIGQGLAVKRLDLMRGLVLSNTAAKIGTPALWQSRIEAIRAQGMEGFADAAMERWFSNDFRKGPDLAHWRDQFCQTPVEGYVGCCAAISGTDFYTPTSGLRLPTLGIAGSEDRATPADLVRETVDLIPGSKFALIRKTGHLPCVEKPAEYAAILATFLSEIGHV